MIMDAMRAADAIVHALGEHIILAGGVEIELRRCRTNAA